MVKIMLVDNDITRLASVKKLGPKATLPSQDILNRGNVLLVMPFGQRSLHLVHNKN